VSDLTGADAELDSILDSTYVCTRVWEAWQYKTMAEDDFIPAAEADVRADLIAWRDAAVAAAPGKPGDEAEAEPASAVTGGGQFMFIAFMGRVELTGYVTEITLGGEPGFHIDLPGKLWGGNPLAWEEYSAKVLFSRRPLTEEYVRKAWEASLRAAEKRRQQEAEWRRMQEQRALTAGAGDHDPDEDPDDEDDPF